MLFNLQSFLLLYYSFLLSAKRGYNKCHVLVFVRLEVFESPFLDFFFLFMDFWYTQLAFFHSEPVLLSVELQVDP